MSSTSMASSSALEAPAAPPSASAPSPAALPENLVREEKEIIVAGKKEHWRLEWKTAPSLACFDDGWLSCPCQNVAFGEIGDLYVIRRREGAPEERALLEGMALQHWPVYEADAERYAVAMDLEVARKRPSIPILEFEDYDHDGRATEFIIDHGSSPCMAHETMVVGSTLRNAKPHLFTVKGHPDTPLTLNGRWQWEAIRDASIAQLNRGIELTQSVCGNHGSGAEYTYFVRRIGDEFEVTARTYICNGPNDTRGTLLESKSWPESGTP